MSWIRVEVDVAGADAEMVGDRLLELGAVAVSVVGGPEDEVFEPGPGELPSWRAPHLSVLLPLDADLAKIRAELLAAHVPALAAVEFVDDQDWQHAWRQHAVERRFGDGLWVVPRDAAQPVGVALRLEPGLAFGTGAHPTTSMCLEWLAEHDLRGRRVLDFGCGSGILGLAASLLGAAHVVAVDHDPQALCATRDNAAYNGVPAHRLTVSDAGDFSADARFDLVLANILARPLMDLADLLSGVLVAGGTLVLSGVQPAQAAQVQEAYYGVVFEPPLTEAGWVRLVGVKTDRTP